MEEMFLRFLEYCVTISSVVDLCSPKGVINSFYGQNRKIL